MKLADNYDMHKISEKFDNESDGTGDSRVTSPWLSKKKKKKKKKKKTAIITLVISVAPFLLDFHETCR